MSKKAGRRIKLNERKQKKIVKMIEAGNFANVAAAACGIGERTYWRWLEQGREAAEKFDAIEEKIEEWNEMTYQERVKNLANKPDDSELPTENEYKCWQFWLAITEAEAKAEANAIEVIRNAAIDGDWRAAFAWLERKHAGKWGKQDQLKVSGEVDHNHQHVLLENNAAEVEEARAKILEARKKQIDQKTVKELEAQVLDAEAIEIPSTDDEIG